MPWETQTTVVAAGDGIHKVTAALNGMAGAANNAAAGLARLRDEQKRGHDLANAANAVQADLDPRGGTPASDRLREKFYGPQWQSATGPVGAVSTTGGGTNASGLQGYQGTEGLNPLAPENLDKAGYKAGSYRPNRENVHQYDMQVASDMETFANNLDKAEGRPTYIAYAYRTVAGFIREFRFSGNDAKQYLQAILFNFQGGAFQEKADPTASPQLQALLSEFLQFESSGRV